MSCIQVISKILQDGDTSILDDYMITREYFIGWEQEYDFIMDHKQQYGCVPDKATFLMSFPKLKNAIVQVDEPIEYLVDSIREEYLFSRARPVLEESARLLGNDSNAAVEYLLSHMKNLEPSYRLKGTDIIAQADDRYQQYVEMKDRQQDFFFTTGFPELDDLIHGIKRTEEFFVIVARTNQGKSWVLEKICTHIWQIGYNVGFVSPEMGANSIGYRFDTLLDHYSNNGLEWGKDDVDPDEYKTYIEDLKKRDNKFIVSTPLDFNKSITITKLRNWIKQYKLDLVAIDGITYLSDERGKRGDNKTTTLTNISEDLMALSMEMHVPILIVVQANRTGVVEKGKAEAPELESIRDSDGISYNATKVLSIQQKEYGVLTMIVKKQRLGPVGGKLLYDWDINRGEFTFLPSYDDAEDNERTQERADKIKRSYKDTKDVF